MSTYVLEPYFATEVGNRFIPDTPMKETTSMVGAENPTAAPVTADPAVPVDPCEPEFEGIYETYFPLLRRIAMRKFGIPVTDVDELVHDVFATYLTHATRVRELRPYLIGGICNAARQYWRARDAEREVFCDPEAVADAGSDDALLQGVIRNALMSQALAQLGPSCRETLHRFYIEGESAIRIAASRNTTPNSIHQLLNFCRASVRKAFRAMTEDS